MTTIPLSEHELTMRLTDQRLMWIAKNRGVLETLAYEEGLAPAFVRSVFDGQRTSLEDANVERIKTRLREMGAPCQ